MKNRNEQTTSAPPDGLILGLKYSGNHDTAVALVTPEGEVVSACALERLSRVKQDGRLPTPLLEDLPWKKIAVVAVSDPEKLEEPANSRSHLHPTPLKRKRGPGTRHAQPFFDYLDTLPVPRRFVCHHLSHAASSFWPSRFEEALCLVYDGGVVNSPWFGGLYHASRQHGIEPLDRFAVSRYAKITSVYTAITAMLGFTPLRHEGKITGLAAYGKPSAKCRRILEKLFTADYDTMEGVVEWLHAYSVTTPPLLFTMDPRRQALLERFEGIGRETIAATLQAMTEEHIAQILANARARGWRSDSICLSGGLFANVKVNQKVKELGFRNVFVAPPMTDDGSAWGAALVVASEGKRFRPKPLRDVFFGPAFNEAAIQAAAKEFGLRLEKLSKPAADLARELAGGAIVAIFQGRMEFGPRALGNRSILCQATDPAINASLNRRLRRTEFMPFAPITRVEDAGACYRGLDGAEHAAEFMTITCTCTKAMKKQSPAVVHVDGTARPQLVGKDAHPLLHEILTEYKRLTGIPSLVNTSFNIHEEPIVCKPADAMRGFLESGLDVLYLDGGFAVRAAECTDAALRVLRERKAQSAVQERAADAANALSARVAAGLLTVEKQQAEMDLLRAATLERGAELAAKQAEIDRLFGEIQARDAVISDLQKAASERLEAAERANALLGEAQILAATQADQIRTLSDELARGQPRLEGIARAAEERLRSLRNAENENRTVRAEARRRAERIEELTSELAAFKARIQVLDKIIDEREGIRHKPEPAPTRRRS